MKNVSSDQLLISRRDAARMLGKSVQTVIRLEEAGRLTKIKLNQNPNAGKNTLVSLRLSEVQEIVDGKR